MGYFSEKEENTRELKLIKIHNARLLGKWVKVLFWLQILAIVGNFLESDFLGGSLPVVYLLGKGIGLGVVIAQCVILIRLKEVEDWFHKAGTCFLISALSGVLLVFMLLMGIAVLSGILALVMVVVELRGRYDEYVGYEVVLKGVDDTLAGQWPIQWKWELRCVIVTMVAKFFIDFPGFFGILAVIVLLVAVVGAIILGIRRMVYMHRTAECFRGYTLREEMVEYNK